jgi:hypothetical protein
MFQTSEKFKRVYGLLENRLRRLKVFVLNLGFWSFDIVSDFVLRISDLPRLDIRTVNLTSDVDFTQVRAI